jgi:hypothetical protein
MNATITKNANTLNMMRAMYDPIVRRRNFSPHALHAHDRGTKASRGSRYSHPIKNVKTMLGPGRDKLGHVSALLHFGHDGGFIFPTH